MTEEFDTVIIGSGFGGSVMAYRLASLGSVCILERGRVYPPGSFPRSPYQMRRAFWDPSEGLYGMFNVWSFRHFAAVVSSGVGGGSLIYANVMLRKDRNWFVHERGANGEDWPISYEDLEPHYADVERNIGVTPFPFRQDARHTPTRTAAFTAGAETLGWDWFTPPLAVTFAAPGESPGEPIREAPNLHGVTRSTCRLTGECDIGCNYGSKNSLDYNYLSRACDAHAVLRPMHEVNRFERLADGRYRVHYVVHDPSHPTTTGSASPRTGTIVARRLVLAAGSLGSPYLLLRNLSAFPKLSPQLGKRFSGNGDLLTLVLRPTSTAGGRREARPIEAGTAPSITAAIRFPDAADTGDAGTGRGFYLQDAGYPDLLNWMIQAGSFPDALWRWRHIGARIVRQLLHDPRDTDLSAEVAALLGDGGLTAGILPLLGMGRDTPGGHMYLADKYLQIDWTINQSRPYFQRVRAAMQAFAHALNGAFADNPLWHIGNRVITAHPLGGAPMGHSVATGVVDEWGRVFNYPGMYIADGSVLPGSVGPNPSLTIAAVADRIASGIEARGE